MKLDEETETKGIASLVCFVISCILILLFVWANNLGFI